MSTLTVNDLIAAYMADPISPYRKLRHRTRINYESSLRRIGADYGNVSLADLKYRTFLEWHMAWSSSGIPMAHDLMKIVRILVGFGMAFLEDAECERLVPILHKHRFSAGSPRTQVLTADQVVAIRELAHRRGLPMIALEQAIQFEGTLRQRDVIGEWVPMDEPGMSDVTWAKYGEKWLRGIRWNEIDEHLVLRHVTSKKLKIVEVDLKLAPMVIEELEIAFCDLGDHLIEYDAKGNVKAVHRELLPASGPIIVDPDTGRPYRPHKFRTLWRELARGCGIPDEIQNRDSRAGAITEATDSGADLEAVRHAAAHSTTAMTARYSRLGAKKTAEVMRRRVAYRTGT